MDLSYEARWLDLRIRTVVAIERLDDLAANRDGQERARLEHKAEGVRLVLSYIDELDRAGAPQA